MKPIPIRKNSIFCSCRISQPYRPLFFLFKGRFPHPNRPTGPTLLPHPFLDGEKYSSLPTTQFLMPIVIASRIPPRQLEVSITEIDAKSRKSTPNQRNRRQINEIDAKSRKSTPNHGNRRQIKEINAKSTKWTPNHDIYAKS